MTQKVCIIILGGTGDLARRKLVPSLYALFRKKNLTDFEVIGVARRSLTSKQYTKNVSEFIGNKKYWNGFSKKVHYVQLEFDKPEGYLKLSKIIKNFEKHHRIFYLATVPEFFEGITTNLAKFNLVRKESKLLYEKPFGHDLKSARKINKCIHKLFKEKQIYRIDHYLNKELVDNISVVRFTNIPFEPVWNHRYIDHIQIIISEKLGIGGRASYYDKYGVVKDIFQNHMMQLLALATMGDPKKYNAKYIRDEKVKLIKKVKIDKCVVGQYEGYHKEPGVKKNSKTATFAAVKAFIKKPRWKNVPVYMLSGKKLEKKLTRVYVRFKNTPCKLFEGICLLSHNEFVISIHPDDGIYFTINTKVPGSATTTVNKLDFCYSCKYGPNTPEAYENLFLEAIKGNQSAFVRSDEIEEEWKVIEKIKKSRLFAYRGGTFPKQARDFISKDGRAWSNL